jgi:protein TonB
LYVSAQERAASAVAALLIVLLIVLALIFGLRVGQAARIPGALVSVRFAPEEPRRKQPRPVVRRTLRPAAKGARSPRNLHNKATPVVARPVAPLIVPPPIVVATQAGTGLAAANGASDRPGPGQGAGGQGNGLGGGGNGGEGEGGGAVVGPRQIRGKLSFSDLPDGLLAPGEERRVGVRYTVETDGTVTGCRADEPSGIPELDALACRLIEQRFRFRPARDAQGRAVRSTVAETHTWLVRQDDDRSHG